MKIELDGQTIQLDRQDLSLFFTFPWRVVKTGRQKQYKYVGFRSRRSPNRGKRFWLYRMLLKTKRLVDHKNRDGLDNRRKNLRRATYQQNARNHRLYGHNTSGHTGVVWLKNQHRWRAEIWVDRHQVYIGVYTSKTAAVRARQKAAVVHHGKFASTVRRKPR